MLVWTARLETLRIEQQMAMITRDALDWRSARRVRAETGAV